MAGKKYTVIIIPNNTSGTRRFGVSRRAVWGAALFVLALVGVSLFLAYDRFDLEQDLKRLVPLRERTRAQRELMERFEDRLRGLDKSLVQLRRLEDQLRIMASLKPKERGGDLGVGGVTKDDLLDDLESLAPSERRLVGRLNRQFLDHERQAAEQERAFKGLVQVFREKSVLLAHTPSILPVRGWVTSSFGYRKSAFTNRKEFHAGIDIVARTGAPILAPADGVVIKVGRKAGFGKILEVRHMQGITTRYAHNQKNLVRAGQRVNRGDIIARVGSTGRSTGPHLHYEVRLNGVAVNPMLYVVEAFAARR